MAKQRRMRRARRPAYKKRRNVKRRKIKRVKRTLGLNRLKQFSGFPAGKIAKFRLSNRVFLDPVEPSSWSSAAISANNPNNPAAGATQPRGWDQWTQYYNHYVVIGSKITCRAIVNNPGASGAPWNVPIAFGVKLLDVPVTSPVALSGNNWQFIDELGYNHKLWIPSQNSNRPQVVTARYSPKKFFNIANIKDNLTRLGAAVGNSPTEQAYYNMWFATMNNDQIGTESLLVLVTVEYIVLFSEPKEIGLS